MKNNLPKVSIVGRPNVGKSSLFNRLIGRRHAVVEEREGTTRDRLEAEVRIKSKKALLVDTGGFDPDSADPIFKLVKKQIEAAIAFSDALLFVCDGEKGLVPLDMKIADILRKSGKRIICAVNKIDNKEREENVMDFFELGIGEPIAISCLHDSGTGKLLREIEKTLPAYEKDETPERNPIKIAIVGRPNVGKSSFLNKVLDEERVIVHEKPGTTRDSIDIYFEKDGILFLLIDTAGMRHRRKVKEAVDIYSMARSERSIDASDVVILIFDGMEGVTTDDVRILDYIIEKGKGCVICVNKWDLVKGIEMSRYVGAIARRIPEAANFPTEFISAKTGRNALNAFNKVKAVKSNLDLFISNADLRRFLKDVDPENVPISSLKKRTKFYFMTQTNSRPKEFTVFVRNSSLITGAHDSYIKNRLWENFPLNGVPLKINYKSMNKKKETLK